jgi:hypothetical protein
MFFLHVIDCYHLETATGNHHWNLGFVWSRFAVFRHFSGWCFFFVMLRVCKLCSEDIEQIRFSCL